MFLWCIRDGWRDIYTQRERTYSSHIFFHEPEGANACNPLASSAETPRLGCVSLTRLRFSSLCLNLTAWFSSRDPLPGTHLFDLSALIVLSCLLITTWQLVKAHGVTMNEPKIHGICYITPWNYPTSQQTITCWRFSVFLAILAIGLVRIQKTIQ